MRYICSGFVKTPYETLIKKGQVTMRTILLLYLLLLPFLSFGQEKIGYAYDAAGNRMKRELVLPVRHSKSKQRTAKPASSDFSDQFTGHTVTITPDPTSGMVRVRLSRLSATDRCTVAAYTSQGAEVYTASSATDGSDVDLQVDLSHQPAGVYLLKITVNDHTSTWKITQK